MGQFTAVYDACVLYPAPLRDFRVHLARTGLFRAKWTDQIHEEWIGGLLKERPDLSRERLGRTRRLMNEAVMDCLVSGYEELVAGIELPDPDDRHVLAAAIHVHANAIVTFNTKDFPPSALDKYSIDALHPDDFIVHQFGLSAPAVCVAAKRQREMLLNPPKSVDEHLETLAQQGLVQTVALLREYATLI